jgi:hypothetical protein
MSEELRARRLGDVALQRVVHNSGDGLAPLRSSRSRGVPKFRVDADGAVRGLGLVRHHRSEIDREGRADGGARLGVGEPHDLAVAGEGDAVHGAGDVPGEDVGHALAC